MNIQLEMINNLIKDREQLLVNDNYSKYIGRNRRIQHFLEYIKPYLLKEPKEVQEIIPVLLDKHKEFKNIPMIDTSKQGRDLYNL